MRNSNRTIWSFNEQRAIEQHITRGGGGLSSYCHYHLRSNKYISNFISMYMNSDIGYMVWHPFTFYVPSVTMIDTWIYNRHSWPFILRYVYMLIWGLGKEYLPINLFKGESNFKKAWATKLISFCVCCCQQVSDGVRGCQIRSGGVILCQGVSNDVLECQTPSDNIWHPL